MSKAEENKKKEIISWMTLLENCKKVFDEEGTSLAVQKKVQKMKYEGCSCPEVESPELDNTGGEWIRLCYEDCYLFLFYEDDGTYKGKAQYDVTPTWCYGDEIIVEHSYEDFVEAVRNYKDIMKHYK